MLPTRALYQPSFLLVCRRNDDCSQGLADFDGRAVAVQRCGVAACQRGSVAHDQALLLPAARAQAAGALRLCMVDNNPPLSYLVRGQPRGLDVRIGQALAQDIGRPLQVVPFESEYEQESTLAHEVSA